VGAIVMGLHSSPLTAARMGSVTYRVLCLTRKLVLALPPELKATIPDRVGRVGASIRRLGAGTLNATA